MRFLCVIPARLGSSRLPAKPLRLIAGEPLIHRVARRVVEFDLDARIVVATDHASIADAVADLPVTAVLTPTACSSGTERVWMVVQQPEHAWAQVILNVQGDEPLAPRGALTGALDQVMAGADVGTAAGPLSAGAATDPHRVKVMVDGRGRALGFYRGSPPEGCARGRATLQHMGVYAYRLRSLQRWVASPEVEEERTWGLEQLRPLRLGMTIGVAMVPAAPAPGVDTAADVQVVEDLLAATRPGMVA